MGRAWDENILLDQVFVGLGLGFEVGRSSSLHYPVELLGLKLDLNCTIVVNREKA